MSIGIGELRDAIYAREIASSFYLRNPLVTLIDVGWKIKDGGYTDQLAVRVHLRRKIEEAAFEAFSLENPGLVIDKTMIPFTVDIIEATYPLHWWWMSRLPDARARAYNPLQGGISVSGELVFGFGTLGGIVEDRDTHEKMILSNWHVLAGSHYAVQGTRIFQPAYGDFGTGSNTVATLERHAFDQEIDAAVARLNGSREWVNDQLGIGPVTGVKMPALSMCVIKSGRGSEITHGFIDGIEGEYPIRYMGVLHRIKYVHRIVPQPGYSVVSCPGDSGSWWLEESTHRAVGLHFAGKDYPQETALAISMPQVLDALNVDIALALPRAVEVPAIPQPIQPTSLVTVEVPVLEKMRG